MLLDRMWLAFHKVSWIAVNNLRVLMVKMRMPARCVNRLTHLCADLYVEGMFK